MEKAKEEDKLASFVSQNWKWIGAMFIYGALAFAQWTSLTEKVDTNERRLQTYIDRYNEQKNLVHDLEIKIVTLEVKIENLQKQKP